MVCNRKKRENRGDSEDFHILAKVQRPQGKTGKRKEKKRVEKQSSTALFGATWKCVTGIILDLSGKINVIFQN